MNNKLSSALLQYVKGYLRTHSKFDIGTNKLQLVSDILAARINTCCTPIHTVSNSWFVRGVIDLLREMWRPGDNRKIQEVKLVVDKYIQCCKVKP